MKSRPLRVGGGGGGGGQGPGQDREGADRENRTAGGVTRATSKNTQSPDALSTVGICSAKRPPNTLFFLFFVLFFLSVSSQRVLAPNHTRAAWKRELFAQSPRRHRGQPPRFTNAHLRQGTFARYRASARELKKKKKKRNVRFGAAKNRFGL